MGPERLNDFQLPVFNLQDIIKEFDHLEESLISHLSPEVVEVCAELAKCLENTGALLVRDPRCNEDDNSIFIDMMERYFSQSDAKKNMQAKPELHFQVGVTPEGYEVPRAASDSSIRAEIETQKEENKAALPSGPDKKWRYMWRIGSRPENSKYKELNSEPVVPPEFSDWEKAMNGWGEMMLATINTVSKMAALGFNLNIDAFTSLLNQGPHLLAPTGSDLTKHGSIGTVLAGYHYDFNFLTIHGQSRFPGLSIWLKDGKKVNVKVPSGCLLLQAGKELEWLTGGRCKAGMHEVVVSQGTIEAVEKAKQKGKCLWRVSSTLFAHLASDALMQPLGHFSNEVTAINYPPIEVGKFVESELDAINLRNTQQPLNGGR